MKKLVRYVSLILIIAGLVACSNIVNNNDGNQSSSTQTGTSVGSATVEMFVPDYYSVGSQNARVVAPQTVQVKFGYNKNGSFTYLDPVKLEDAEKTAVSGADSNAGLSGNTYKFVFKDIPAGTYAAGKMKVQLLNSAGTVISEGENSSSVTVEENKTKSVSFYTIPTSSNASESSLAAGEMKFYKITLSGGVTYKLKMEIGSGDSSYPDLVFFNENGTYSSYISIDSASEAVQNLPVSTSDTVYYVGIYADDNKAVTSYKISFVSNLPKTLSENFEGSTISGNLKGEGCNVGVVEDVLLKKWIQYGDALVDEHSKIYKLGNRKDSGTSVGDSTLTISKIAPEVESALSFDFKLDIHKNDALQVLVDDVAQNIYIDGVDAGTSITGYAQIWRKASVVIPSGEHIIKIQAKKLTSYYGTSITNAAYIDNISIIPNTVASVSVEPKGLQETYVGGFDIQFTAKALRSDGSVINGKTVTWTGAADGKFHPTSEGTNTVTATIDGISGSNSTVKVHSANYLSEPVTINGVTYTGASSTGTGTRKSSSYVTWDNSIPQYQTFEADGFFELKGTVSNYDLYVEVQKETYKTYYFFKNGKFDGRIWLRFGSGSYGINIYALNITYAVPDNGYAGDFTGFGNNHLFVCRLNVENTNSSVPEADAAYLMPSYWCQMDDLRVSNAAHDLLAKLPENATDGQKLAAIHDWETHRMYYDYDSSGNSSKRKAQDAANVLEYEIGVCEGYANLFTAMERLMGIKGTIVCSNETNHAWNNTYYKGQWLLIDTTWDDPTINGVKGVKNEYNEYYKYFLLTAEQDAASGTTHGSYAISRTTSTGIGSDGEQTMRNAVPAAVEVPYINYLPDGWY